MQGGGSVSLSLHFTPLEGHASSEIADLDENEVPVQCVVAGSKVHGLCLDEPRSTPARVSDHARVLGESKMTKCLKLVGAHQGTESTDGSGMARQSS